jgi:hypothetical protein
MGLFDFLGFRKNAGNEPGANAIFTENQKAKYRHLLTRNPNKHWQQEFVRTSNLEYALLTQYGFDAVRFLFEKRNSANYFLLGQFPADCPWHHLNEADMPGLIDQQFAPIALHIPELVSIMKQRCLFIYTEKLDDTWHLHYMLRIQLHDGRDYYRVYTGGAPNARPGANEHLQLFHWQLPTDLQAFYQVHNGFGEIYDANYIMASHELRVMAEIMNPICEEENDFPAGYRFEDLLEFFPDGGGNVQCFYRGPGTAANHTVDWDHETRELSNELPFFAFINQRLAELDEE